MVISPCVNRTIDFSYSYSISTHLEIELNDKQNDLGSDNGNGVLANKYGLSLTVISEYHLITSLMSLS